MSVSWTDIVPGDTRDAGWLNLALDGLADETAALDQENFRVGGMRREQFSDPPAFRPFASVQHSDQVDAAWPTTWGPLPGAAATSTSTAFEIPPWSVLVVTAAFEFVTTDSVPAIPGSVAPDIVTPEWRIKFVIFGNDVVDAYSHGWIGEGKEFDLAGGSAICEATVQNPSNLTIEVDHVMIQVQEALGSTIQVKNTRLQGIVLVGVL